jgi:hypothetical protein
VVSMASSPPTTYGKFETTIPAQAVGTQQLRFLTKCAVPYSETPGVVGGDSIYTEGNVYFDDITVTEVPPLGPVLPAPAVIERLVNPGFEDQSSVWKILYASDTQVEGTGIFTNSARSGTSSYQSNGIDRTRGYAVQFYQDVAIVPGQIYVFGGYMKQEVPDNCEVEVTFGLTSRNTDSLVFAASPSLDYTYYTGATNVRDSGTGRLTVYVRCPGGGTKVYFDDFSFS